jgi:hypothetical protein
VSAAGDPGNVAQLARRVAAIEEQHAVNEREHAGLRAADLSLTDTVSGLDERLRGVEAFIRLTKTDAALRDSLRKERREAAGVRKNRRRGIL